jgi:glycosyltransferase involved in cell wall biosynthesis
VEVVTAPVVTAIVPVFNRAGTIGHAVKSLAQQSLADIEIIVVDDGSTDASAEVAAAAGGSLVRVLCHGFNRGIPAARNTGLQAARGKYIAWLDSDDLARPSRLERQAAYLEHNPDVALVGASARRIDERGRRKFGARVPFLAHEVLEPALLFRSPFQQSSIMARADVLKEFEYRSEFPVCEDLDMFIRVSREHRTANLKEVLIDRRIHDGQIGRVEHALVRDRKRVLLRPLLQEIGIDPTSEDLDRHITLGAMKGQAKDREYVAWADQWMKRLRSFNKRHKRYDERGLALVCGRAWLNTCYAARRGNQRALATKAFLGSSLTLGLIGRPGLEWLADALPYITGLF